MEAFETFEHAGFTVELHQDMDPMPPSEWDQLGELVAFDPLWREYRFAERNSTQEEDDALDRGGLRLLARYLRMTQEGAVIVGFAFLDYGSGGQSLHAVDLDSTSAAGFIVTTPARWAELMGKRIDTEAPGAVETVLRGELETWGSYVAGEVVGYVVRDGRGEVVASCWGFYPDESKGNGWPDPRLEYVREQAREAAEYERDYRAKRALETRRGWAWAHGQREAMPV